jgi:ABC-type transporter Mla subunit MlaD
MVIETPYELKIPRDSVASTATAGVLGETYVEIDVSEASGQPIQAGGQLPSKESVKFIDQAMRVIESLKQLSGEQKNRNTQPSSPQSTGKPVPRRSLSSTPR